MTELIEARVTEAYPLVAIVARKFPPPPGLSVDDLESAGGESLLEAAAVYTPDRGPWPMFARGWLRNTMREVVSRHRRKDRRRADLEVRTADGDEHPRPDPRAADPADLAAAREALRPGRQTLSVRRLRGTMPAPDVVADRVAALREAMFASVTEANIATVMGVLVRKAEGGDLKAIRQLLDYLQPGRSGVTVQQAVVVNGADLG